MATVINVLALREMQPDFHQDEKIDPYMLIKPLLDENTDTSSSLIRLYPGTTQPPHFHRAGADIFFILSGEGILRTATLNPDERSGSDWVEHSLKAGALYSIKPMEIHGVQNTGTEDIIWLNISPTTHETTDYFPLDRP